jgi:hypothetical protein
LILTEVEIITPIKRQALLRYISSHFSPANLPALSFFWRTAGERLPRELS